MSLCHSIDYNMKNRSMIQRGFDSFPKQSMIPFQITQNGIFLCVVGPSNLVISFCGFKDFFIYTYMYMNLDVCILHIQTCTRTGVFNVWPQLLAILIRNLNHCKIHCKLLADIRWLEINWWTPQICEVELVKKEQYSNQYFPQHLFRLAKWHLFSVLRKCLLTLD